MPHCALHYGSGKSTFIKLLVGELEPDSGRVARGKSATITYFDQNRVELNPDKSLWTTLCPEGDYVFLGAGEKPVHVCGYLKQFLFDPRLARDKVGMAKLAEEIEKLKKLLENGDLYMKDPDTFDKASRCFAQAQQELSHAETRWLELEEMRPGAK